MFAVSGALAGAIFGYGRFGLWGALAGVPLGETTQGWCAVNDRVWNKGSVTMGPSDKISVPPVGRLETLTRVEGQRTGCQDRVEVFRRADLSVVIVADGAGGTSGGEAAAATVVETVRQRFVEPGNLLDPATWKRVLGAVGEKLESNGIGQSTAVVVATDGSIVSGASVGDSEAWLVGVTDLRDLSAGQPRKPLLGGGSVEPRAFKEQLRPGDALLVATDGITKYASAERICSVVRRADLSPTDRCAAIVQWVRLSNGSLQDDVGLAIVRWVPILLQEREG